MIIILGDSWGVGEWGMDKNEFCLIGPGIGQYISMHNTVINLSLGSGSNTQSLSRFELLLEKYQIDCQFDTVYWIVTDPLRCVDDADLRFSESIESKVKFLLNQCLSRADFIGKKYQITINLIGGLCDLNNIDISNYEWLNISVPSWGMLIDKNYNSSLYCLSTKWKLIGELADTPIKKSEWFDLTKLCEEKRKSMKNIFPTDQQHPDRHGHILLRNYLYPEWKHKF
jgi:hypothetical protein